MCKRYASWLQALNEYRESIGFPDHLQDDDVNMIIEFDKSYNAAYVEFTVEEDVTPIYFEVMQKLGKLTYRNQIHDGDPDYVYVTYQPLVIQHPFANCYQMYYDVIDEAKFNRPININNHNEDLPYKIAILWQNIRSSLANFILKVSKDCRFSRIREFLDVDVVWDKDDEKQLREAMANSSWPYRTKCGCIGCQIEENSDKYLHNMEIPYPLENWSVKLS